MLDQIQPILTLAEQHLSKKFTYALHLEPTKQLDSQHFVLRCRVHAEGAKTPQSVIIKQVNDESTSQFSPRQLFLNEWACLEFLSTLAPECGPQLYTSDESQQLVIMEDLGECPSLQDIFYGDDPVLANRVLTELATLLGSLHRAATDHEPRFLEIQTRLNASTAVSDGNADLRELLPDLHESFQILGVSLPGNFETALYEVTEAMDGASPFRTFTHFDAGPHNIMLTESGLKLLDYELAGFGNGLIDLSSVRMAFPAAFRGRRVPRANIETFETTYLAQFVGIDPLITDLYPTILTQACAHHAYVKYGVSGKITSKPASGQEHNMITGQVTFLNVQLIFGK